ncbi:MAG TPA: phosphoglycerate mutase family protein [Candidatus Dormibacteraeota bacterium]
MSAQLRSFYVIRHAKAGSREKWAGDDRKRPLTKKGIKQAQDLVEVLSPYPVASIFSSQYLRCVQTVQPLARRLRLKVEESVSLAEGRGLAGLHEFLDDGDLDNAVLCTHGDIVWELVEDMVKRKILRAGEGGFDKGSTWILHVDGSKIAKARYLPAP